MFAMSCTCHFLSMVIFFLSYSLCHLKFQVHMATQWMTWTRCAMVALGIPPKPQISKMTLDCLFDDLLVQVISNVRMLTAITCIATEVCAIAPSEQVHLISHLLWVMLPLLDPFFECKVCRAPHVCIALCHARILYVRSTSIKMSRAYIHLGMYDHPISNGIWCESLDTTYQCVTNEILKNTHRNKFNYSFGCKQAIFGWLFSQIFHYCWRPSSSWFIIRGGHGQIQYSCIPKLS